jgi:carboxypeptidase C (cathepsin A)
MLDDGNLPPPPYELVDNPHTWLEQTDLVFIDPVGTGFSRPAKPELGKKFWGVKQDIDSVGTFIRRYLSRVERFSSPLFLAGESYGTTRAAGLAGWLVDKGIALNGVVLISTVLSFQTLRDAPGNDLPYPLRLPTYTATAWYHKKLPPDLQNADLQKALRESRDYALNGYPLALAKGDRLTIEERRSAIDKLARLTGLEKRYLDLSDLRVDVQHFTKELLRNEKRTVGRLDSRIKGVESNGVGETVQADPSMTAIRPPYTSLINDYARSELGFKTDLEYFSLGGGITSPWDFGPAGGGSAETGTALRSAFERNPYMRVMVANGYYDMATPFFATEYTLAHLGLDATARSQVTVHEYEAGHMMYIHKPSLEKLSHDVRAFYGLALKR